MNEFPERTPRVLTLADSLADLAGEARPGECTCAAEDMPFGRCCKAAPAPVAPIDMVLHCPACGLQHIDGPDERTPGWTNAPHRSHLCHCLLYTSDAADE